MNTYTRRTLYCVYLDIFSPSVISSLPLSPCCVDSTVSALLALLALTVSALLAQGTLLRASLPSAVGKETCKGQVRWDDHGMRWSWNDRDMRWLWDEMIMRWDDYEMRWLWDEMIMAQIKHQSREHISYIKLPSTVNLKVAGVDPQQRMDWYGKFRRGRCVSWFSWVWVGEEIDEIDRLIR
jgi:hypothetical protein